jgi:hypothetical protein
MQRPYLLIIYLLLKKNWLDVVKWNIGFGWKIWLVDVNCLLTSFLFLTNLLLCICIRFKRKPNSWQCC